MHSQNRCIYKPIKIAAFHAQLKPLHSVCKQNRCIQKVVKFVAFYAQWKPLLSVRCIQKAVTFVSFYKIKLAIFVPFLKSMVVILCFAEIM